MIATGSVTRTGFEAALATARRDDSSLELSGLSAPLDGGLLGKIAEVWDTVETALRQAFVHGADAAKTALITAIANAQALIDNAANRARDVHQALLNRIHNYLAALLDDALSRVKSAVAIGDRMLHLSGVELTNKISLSGAVSIALTDIFNLTAAGEFTVQASYTSTVV